MPKKTLRPHQKRRQSKCSTESSINRENGAPGSKGILLRKEKMRWIQAVADSGCLKGKSENKKGPCCTLWGTSVQKVVGHFIAFCPPEEHPGGHFTTF